jgi:hypothetical protein
MDDPATITGPAGLTPYSPDWLNALSETDRQSLPVRNFSRSLHDDGGEHVAWLLWSVQAKTEPTPLEYRQGSMFFLDCGRGSFAVTAGHVFQQFQKDRAERRVRGYQIGNIGFDLEERLIDCGADRKIDIATFRITPSEIAAVGKKVIPGTDGIWPQPPNIGEVCILAASRDANASRSEHENIHSVFTAEWFPSPTSQTTSSPAVLIDITGSMYEG